MIAAIRNIDNGIAHAHAIADDKLWPISDALVARLNVPLKALLGEQKLVTDMPAATGSEDVHLLLGEHTQVPLAFLLVGVADPAVFAQARQEGKFVPYSAHNPNYIVDLAAIPVGTKVATKMVSELLAKP